MESPLSSRKITYSSTPEHRAPYKLTKLKASCDFCALSKVKCDRGQPQCMRCIKNAVECHYSEARRIGRARQTYAASRLTATSQGKQQFTQDQTDSQGRSRSPFRSATLRDRLDSISSSASSLSLPSCAFQTPLSLPDGQPTCLKNDTGFLPKLFDDPFNASYYMENQSPTDHDLQNFGSSNLLLSPELLSQMPHFLNTRRLPAMDTSEEMDQSPIGTLGFPHSMPNASDMMDSDDSIHSIPPADCMRRSLQLLESMHVTRNPCSLADSRLHERHPQGFDACLRNNRIAVDTMLKILDCPCSRTPSLLFLLVLIAHLVIESYGALHAHHIAGFATSDDGNLDPSDRLPEVPVAIGTYLPDTDTRRKLIVEVVRSELKKMGALLDALSAMDTQLGGIATGRIGLGSSLASLLKAHQEALQSAREWCDGDKLREGRSDGA